MSVSPCAHHCAHTHILVCPMCPCVPMSPCPMHVPKPTRVYLCHMCVPCPMCVLCPTRVPLQVTACPMPVSKYMSSGPALGSPSLAVAGRRTLGVGGDPWGQHPWVILHPTGPWGLTENLIHVLQFGDRHGGTELGTEGTVREGGTPCRGEGGEGESRRELRPLCTQTLCA